MKKRLLSALMLIIIFIVLIISFPNDIINAASTTISVSDVIGKEGEIISVPVKVSGNTGFCDFGLIIIYDNTILIPKAIKSGDVWEDELVTNLKHGNNSIMVSGSGVNNKNSDGIIFTIEFTIKKSIKKGKYAIKLRVDNINNLSDAYTLDKISVVIKDGAVQIGKDTATIETKKYNVKVSKLNIEFDGRSYNVAGCVIDGKAYVKLVDISDITKYYLAYDKSSKEHIVSNTIIKNLTMAKRDKNSEYGKTFKNITKNKLKINFNTNYHYTMNGCSINGKAYILMADFSELINYSLKYDKEAKKYIMISN